MLSRFKAASRAAASDRLTAALPVVLRTLAEAGWLSVLYAAGAVLADKRAPVISPVEIFLFVGAGVTIGVVGRRRPSLGAIAVIAAVVAGGALGSLAGQDVHGFDDLPAAVGRHFAGWLAGIAVLRGSVISVGEKAAGQLEQMLRVVPASLGVIWAYTNFAARPELWLPFAVAAMWGTGMYLSGSLVGIGLARLNVLHAEVEDARQRRAWRWLIIGVGFTIVPLSVPIAVLAGIPLASMLSPMAGPIQWLLSLVAYPLAFIIWIFSLLLRPIAASLSDFLDEIGDRVTEAPEQVTETPALITALGGLILLMTLMLIALAVYFGARWLLIRRQGPLDELEEGYADVERSIVLPVAQPPRARTRIRRVDRPRDAVSAYLSTVAELETHGELARAPAETPAAHAARLRSFGQVRWPDLARLAATYQLARYGDRSITRVENARAVSRFKRIRRALKRP